MTWHEIKLAFWKYIEPILRGKERGIIFEFLFKDIERRK